MRGRGTLTDPVPLVTVSVTVRVLDTNDNAPQFHEVSPRIIHVGDSIPSGSSVAQMLATDADVGRNGRVVYRLDAGNIANVIFNSAIYWVWKKTNPLSYFANV